MNDNEILTEKSMQRHVTKNKIKAIIAYTARTVALFDTKYSPSVIHLSLDSDMYTMS